jgi:hypothetical protein
MLRWLLIACSVSLLHGPAQGQVRAPAAGFADAPAPILVLQQQGGAEEEPEREPGPANLEEAIEIAKKRYGGEAARADTVVREGRRVHEIRLLGEDNTVRTVRIDPETGRIIPQERRQG